MKSLSCFQFKPRLESTLRADQKLEEGAKKLEQEKLERKRQEELAKLKEVKWDFTCGGGGWSRMTQNAPPPRLLLQKSITFDACLMPLRFQLNFSESG